MKPVGDRLGGGPFLKLLGPKWGVRTERGNRRPGQFQLCLLLLW